MPDRYRDRPFPSDDDYSRDQRHPQHTADNDPLAELARLIGQTDPFSSFGREHQPARRAPVDPHEDPAGYADDDYQQEYDNPPPGPPSWVRNAAQPANPSYGYDDQRDARGDRQREAPPFARGQDQQPRFDQPHEPDARYEDVLYGQPPAERRPEPRYVDRDPRYDDHGYAPDDGYAEEPDAKPRRGGTMTVMVVLALAVLGTAGAYGYRSFMGSPRSGEPPIIRADAGPNKVAPPSQSSDGKLIYDRVGERPGERVVSREEQPVDVNGQPSPRVVFPPLSQNASPPTTAAVSPDSRPTGAGAGNGAVGEEPRKIRTLTIRPDQADGSVAPATNTAPAPRAPAPTRASPVATNAPIALTPQVDQSAPAASAPRARVASVNPAASAPSAGGGSYVQVSSQKNEADALTSFKVVQSKYPGILGSRAPVVRRADLGDKGVYYRALVGPFGTTDEATQFCVNLQSAGGKCIVQRN